MKKYFLFCIKIIVRTILGILVFICSYFIVMGISVCIPVNPDYVEPKDGIKIAVVSNGIHCDILVPVKNDLHDWTKTFSYTDVNYADSTYHYISFGWGDKGFFIGTRTWADFKTSTALKAMFWMSSSAMHAGWEKEIPANSPRCRVLIITKQKYAALCKYISETFVYGKNNLPELVDAKGYSDNDAFYEANGTYNLFQTCNVWAGNALKVAGVRVAIWTPFEKCVFTQLP